VAKRVLTAEEIMTILPATAGRMAELTRELTREQLHAPPEPGEWSVNDVLAHLRACNDVLGGNMRRIIREDHPSWKAMNPRTWQRKSDYHEWPFARAFDSFSRERAALLEVLEAVDDEAWERTGSVRVPPAKTFEYSTRYYGDWLAGHERAHLKRLPGAIAQVLAKR
jgi:hypothetical protein